jgi:predicted nucleic acid-binding protein
LIGKIDILRQLYPNVLAPPSVFAELTRANAPELVRAWMEHPPEWLQMRAPQHIPDEDLIGVRLGPGERDAILLAEELRAEELILDDRRGRWEAERRHLHVIGPLGILRTAAREHLLDLKDALARLRQTNFYISEEIIQRLLEGPRE